MPATLSSFNDVRFVLLWLHFRRTKLSRPLSICKSLERRWRKCIKNRLSFRQQKNKNKQVYYRIRTVQNAKADGFWACWRSQGKSAVKGRSIFLPATLFTKSESCKPRDATCRLYLADCDTRLREDRWFCGHRLTARPSTVSAVGVFDHVRLTTFKFTELQHDFYLRVFKGRCHIWFKSYGRTCQAARSAA